MRCAPILVAVALLVVAGCGDSKRTLETAARSPDAYANYRPAELNVPPDFARRPSKDDTKARAVPTRPARSSRARGPEIPADWAGLSRGTTAFLLETKANEADDDIRESVNRDVSIYATEKPELTNRILFGEIPKAAPAGTENAVVISREKSGLIGKIF